MKHQIRGDRRDLFQSTDQIPLQVNTALMDLLDETFILDSNLLWRTKIAKVGSHVYSII